MRRTKIIATLGPATDKPGMLEKLLNAGVDLFRINYSHQSQEDHARRVREVRELTARRKIEAGIIADLQGPKIRVQRFDSERVMLKEGATFTLDTALDTHAGDATHVGITYKDMPRNVKPGNTLLLDDGRIVLTIQEISDHEVRCKVVRGGELSSNKGVSLQGGSIPLRAFSPKDRGDLEHGAALGVDYFSVSFVRDEEDVLVARQLLEEAGCAAGVIAKFECPEALERAEAITQAADAIMIARGDLGVEIGDANLPTVQKRLIKLARSMDRAAITATQMMQSMIDHQIPLRAEVFDVANAVLDGTDAILLSGETSIGMFPELAVAAASRVCEEAEKQRTVRISDHRINQSFDRIDESVAMAAMYTANHAHAKAIVALTETGSTCVWMSRISSGLPIFAFSRHVSTRRKANLYRGVYPVVFDRSADRSRGIYKTIIGELVRRKIVEDGDLIIITRGDRMGESGGTNTMKLLRVGDAIPDI